MKLAGNHVRSRSVFPGSIQWRPPCCTGAAGGHDEHRRETRFLLSIDFNSGSCGVKTHWTILICAFRESLDQGFFSLFFIYFAKATQYLLLLLQPKLTASPLNVATFQLLNFPTFETLALVKTGQAYPCIASLLLCRSCFFAGAPTLRGLGGEDFTPWAAATARHAAAGMIWCSACVKVLFILVRDSLKVLKLYSYQVLFCVFSIYCSLLKISWLVPFVSAFAFLSPGWNMPI